MLSHSINTEITQSTRSKVLALLYFSEVYAARESGNILVFCHRRLAVKNFFFLNDKSNYQYFTPQGKKNLGGWK